MANAPMSFDECVETLRAVDAAGGIVAEAARRVGISRTTMQSRVETARTTLGGGWTSDDGWTFPRELRLEIENGCAVISSDHHYWPGPATVAHRGLLTVIGIVKPTHKFLNGDVVDGVSVSRHAPFGWARRPNVKQELDACKERVREIELALPKGCERLWNIGNHDIRFERTLVEKAKEFEGLEGWRLNEHFHGWEMQWSVFINAHGPHPVMIKHRQAGGVHAGYNNAMKGGCTIVTGHTHLLEAKPYGNWRTPRYWGIQTGTIADVHGAHAEYQENSASAACSGFAVLTWRDGVLLPPELCEVIDGRAYFRGQVVAE